MEIFSNYTFQIVVLGTALLGGISGILGSFAILRKQSLLGDGISHSALLGVVLAFMLTGNKNTEVLLLGGLITGILAAILIVIITKNSKIKFDTAIAVVMSLFFGLGISLLSYVQKSENANQAGLERFIYGQASAILKRDVKIIALSGIILIIIVILFFKEFKLITFDMEYAKTLGYNVNILNLMLTILIVITIIIGLQSVGVILMSAMLIAPAVSAKQYTNSLHTMIILSGFFGSISGIIGSIISTTIEQIPTGPAIIVTASIIAFTSLFFSPKRGVLL